MILPLFVFAAFLRVVEAQASNATYDQCPVKIPGYFHHGDCNLLCRSATWTDVLIFYLGNYIAHAATVTTLPGQSVASSLFAILTALLFPGGGVSRGMKIIESRAMRAPTQLQAAARAGALCAVVKGEDGEAPGNHEITTAGPFGKILSTKIHGQCPLLNGFDLMVVPPTATFENDIVAEPTSKATICCNYNVIKVIISLVQLLFAISTLYKTRGNQVDIYGYAAFGLTVAPYAWMSLINLLGNIMCPQYDTMFVVESSGYDELQRLHNQGKGKEERASFMVIGTVGRLTASAEKELQQEYSRVLEIVSEVENPSIPNFFTFFSKLLVLFAPLIIVGAISRWQPNQSALYQRIWTMMWLVFGLVMGADVMRMGGYLEGRTILNRRGAPHHKSNWLVVIFAFIYSVPAIGGYVVVGQMIKEFGVCSELDGKGGGL